MNRSKDKSANRFDRLNLIGWSFCLAAVIVVGRLFWVQVIQHGYYQKLADTSHNKKFQIPARRGEILAYDGDQVVPLVLNEKAHTVFADPRYISSAKNVSKELAPVLGVSVGDLQDQLTKDTAYVVLKRQVSSKVAKKIKELNLKGVGTVEGSRRVYPESTLASQLLGFVNSDGVGQYGLEQSLNGQLTGEAGQLNGATDVRGIPIATEDSIVQAPKDGDDLTLTIDRSIQAQAEFYLKEGVEKNNADSGSVIVMDPNNGDVKAMANYPTFKPGNYTNEKDVSVFKNAVVTDAYEPGSVVKIFTMAAALDKGAVTPNTTYMDYSKRKIDGYTIRNTGPVVTKERTMTEVIARSANTGTIFALEQLGGGSINNQAKETLHGYFTDRFRFGQLTGIQQTGESAGFVLKPANAPDVNYANMSFGQGVSMNMVQLTAALGSIANGGKYYRPTLVDKVRTSEGKTIEKEPHLVADNIIKDQTVKDIKKMMARVMVEGTGYVAARDGYSIYGKSGTAEVAKPEGGYYEDREIGSFFGFTSDENSTPYVIMVRVNNPKLSGDAVASSAVVPIFRDINNWLIDYYGIAPRK